MTINLIEGSEVYNSYTTSLKLHLGDLKAKLRSQYQYRPTEETLWAEVFENGKALARYKYNPSEDSLEAITWIKLSDFDEYVKAVSISDGITGETEKYFYVRTKTTRMTSYITHMFSDWMDSFDSEKNFEGYTFILNKIDLHDSFITGNFFKDKL